MRRLQLLPLFLLVVVVVGVCNGVLVEDVRDQVVKEIDTAWQKLKGLDTDSSKQIGQRLKDLGQILSKIPTKISKIERDLTINEYDDALKSLSKVKNTTQSWRDKWSEIALLTSPVDILYGHFKIFPEMPDSFLPGSGYDFDANSITDLILKPLYNNGDSDGTITLKYLIENVHSAAITKTRRERDAFHILSDHIEEALKQSYWCLWNGKTPQRIVYGFYETLATFDIKEYTLLNFAWMLRYSINGTDATGKIKESKQSLIQRTNEKGQVAKDVMQRASSAFWKCDPIKHEEGVTYATFRELLQGYIENEKKMHPSGSCRGTCTDYTFQKAPCDYADEATCHSHRVCTGNIVECKYIAADATVCPADAPRRFDYIEYKRGPTLGNASQQCKKPVEKKNSNWRFLYHCSNCFCLCDDPKSPTTVRHVSLAPVVSDIHSNKIVTGVRFIMKDGILHLQVEEGEAEKGGEILDGSTEWKPTPKVNKKDENKVAVLEYTRRNFDLDDLLVGKDHVVTGVKFRVLGGHLNLEIQATQIIPDSGKLVASSSHWISNDNTPEASSRNARDKLNLEEVDIPTLAKHPNIPDSVHDQYIEFGPTSRYKDVSQTTVPFIDIQEVRPTPPVWLRGVGVYHKGQPGYGGFLAPRIFTVNVADFVRYGDQANNGRRRGDHRPQSSEEDAQP